MTEIERLYSRLEDELKSPRDLQMLWREFVNLRENTHGKESQQAQWELVLLSIRIRNNELRPRFPETDLSDDQLLSYARTRAKHSCHPVLRAHYYHLLWLSPKRHYTYGRKAIDAYLELISRLEEEDRHSSDGHLALQIPNIVENLARLSLQLKHKVSDVKEEVLRLITELDYDSRSSFAVRHRLIDLMFTQPKMFDRKDFANIDGVCESVSKSLIEDGSLHTAIDMLMTATKIAKQKLERDPRPLYLQIARLYGRLTEDAAPNLATYHNCMIGISLSKKADELKMTEIFEERLAKVKSELNLQGIDPPPELTEQQHQHERSLRDYAAELLEKSAEEILEWLANGPLIPPYNDIAERSKLLTQSFPSRLIASPLAIDQSNNIAEHFSHENEREHYWLIRDFGDHIQNVYLLLHDTLLGAIKKGKFSFDILVRFLAAHAWFGKELVWPTAGEQQDSSNWLNDLAPSLRNYFIEVDHHLAYPAYRPNMMICVDSLTLKFEGILRDLYRLLTGKTARSRSDKRNRPILREMNLDDLLREPAIGHTLEQEDILLLRYLFVEKAGLNLRHRIAHCLITEPEYERFSFGYANLLILALLRMARYTLKVRDEERSIDPTS